MSERLANLLGALATAVTDRINDALVAEHGDTPSDVAALLMVAQWPGGTIDSFAKALGLSHSASVRVVDRLVEAGEMERRPGERGRALALVATAKGKKKAQRLLHQRDLALEPLVESLSHEEADALEHTLERLLAKLTTSGPAGDRICRYCCDAQCPTESCPVARVQLTDQDYTAHWLEKSKRP